MIPVSRTFLERDFASLLPAERVILTVPGADAADPVVFERLIALRQAGYRLRIDDGDPPTWGLAHVLCVDGSSAEAPRIAAMLAAAGARPQLMVRNVGEHEQVDRFVGLGFDLFAGSFLARPRPFVAGRAGEHRTSRLRLVSVLQDPDCDLHTLEEIIQADASLSYRLLRFVNSAHFSLPREVNGVREAVVLLGLTNVRTWASLLALAQGLEGPPELLRASLVRARMAQMLALARSSGVPQAAFSVGLFSNLGLLLGVDMDSALAELPLTAEVKAALLAGTGPLGELLGHVVAYEAGRFDEVPATVAQTIGALYPDALRYADGLMGTGLEMDAQAAQIPS